jgi:uncharacterized FlaG/YvyC family protein
MMQALTPEERMQQREAEAKRRRDERERRIAEQVGRLEKELKNLRTLVDQAVDRTGGGGDAH